MIRGEVRSARPQPGTLGRSELLSQRQVCGGDVQEGRVKRGIGVIYLGHSCGVFGLVRGGCPQCFHGTAARRPVPVRLSSVGSPSVKRRGLVSISAQGSPASLTPPREVCLGSQVQGTDSRGRFVPPARCRASGSNQSIQAWVLDSYGRPGAVEMDLRVESFDALSVSVEN